jgi:hypothetical protein
VYRLPRLNEGIRLAIKKYGGAVFPKLNWTSPKVGRSSDRPLRLVTPIAFQRNGCSALRRLPSSARLDCWLVPQDAAFILPVTPRGPLYCTTPADVFLILKSSDFIGHALDPSRAYEGAEDLLAREAHAPERMKIELVLREHVDMNPAREVRCFVRDDVLLGEWGDGRSALTSRTRVGRCWYWCLPTRRDLTTRFELLRPFAAGGYAEGDCRPGEGVLGGRDQGKVPGREGL